MDTSVIDRLIDVLTDTSATVIPNSCGEGNFTYGQLAFLLIDDIEAVPYFAVTHIQFDVIDCGTMPNGLLDYVKNYGSSFQQQLRSYFHSKVRQGKLEEGKRERKAANTSFVK